MGNKKIKKITFSEYYNSLKKTPLDFINKIASECGVTDRTVYNWINGTIIPDKSHQDKIAQITGVPAEHLFKQYKLASV